MMPRVLVRGFSTISSTISRLCYEDAVIFIGWPYSHGQGSRPCRLPLMPYMRTYEDTRQMRALMKVSGHCIIVATAYRRSRPSIQLLL